HRQALQAPAARPLLDGPHLADRLGACATEPSGASSVVHGHSEDGMGRNSELARRFEAGAGRRLAC
ncbi:MAG: hypothetical protein OXG81_02155, partial [Acidobacteria bacterium]|nr:hypothetical protein [Acidobacteriota bacterium]